MAWSPKRICIVIWRWFLTLAVGSMIVNISYNGVRCIQGEIPSCDKELQAQAEARHQRWLELKNADKIQAKADQNFWLTIMSLKDNEVIVDVD